MTIMLKEEGNFDSAISLVSKTIKTMDRYPTRKELWHELEGKMEHYTFRWVMNYLKTHKMIIYQGKRIVWVAVDNPKIKAFLRRSVQI